MELFAAADGYGIVLVVYGNDKSLFDVIVVIIIFVAVVRIIPLSNVK